MINIKFCVGKNNIEINDVLYYNLSIKCLFIYVKLSGGMSPSFYYLPIFESNVEARRQKHYFFYI